MRVATGAELIERERIRQQEREGYDPRHDDSHEHGELVLAAAQYALPPERRELVNAGATSLPERFVGVPYDWPWDNESWKPTPEDRIRELVKAGALIAAEIDRLLRADGSMRE